MIKKNIIKTKNIIDIINGDAKTINKLKLMLKNRTTGETYSTMPNYIMDNILFMCIDENPESESITCEDFIINIKRESEDEMWEESYFPEGCNEEALIDLIVGFPIKVYLGALEEAPVCFLKDEKIVKNIVAVEVTADTLYLVVR